MRRGFLAGNWLRFNSTSLWCGVLLALGGGVGGANADVYTASWMRLCGVNATVGIYKGSIQSIKLEHWRETPASPSASSLSYSDARSLMRVSHFLFAVR